MIIVTAKFKSQVGMRDEIIKLAKPCIEATRKESGCVRYELFISSEDDVTLQFIEEWIDIESLRIHLKSPHLILFKEQRQNIVEKGGILKVFEAEEFSI